MIKDRFKNATPLELPKGWGLPIASLKRELTGDGWILTGDAASLICPTSGEGIGPAMFSGYTAAQFINVLLKKMISQKVILKIMIGKFINA